MAFTFDTSLSTDLALVRFEIGDTREDGHYLEDETINYFITSDSVGGAVVACIEYILSLLSVPNFRQDWLSVDYSTARAGFEAALVRARQKYGKANVSGKCIINNPHRADSYENDDGVYTAPDGLP